jgi:nucleoside-diphosphate-sugar epimerase
MRCVEKISDGSAINLGAEEIVSIDYLAKHIISLSGKKIRIEYDTSGPQGTHRYCADTSNMRKTLEWWPRTPFLEGLKATYEWATKRIADGE